MIGVNEDAATATGLTPDARDRAAGDAPPTAPQVAPNDGRLVAQNTGAATGAAPPTTAAPTPAAPTAAQPASAPADVAGQPASTDQATPAPAGIPARRRPDAGDLVQRAGAAFHHRKPMHPPMAAAATSARSSGSRTW